MNNQHDAYRSDAKSPILLCIDDDPQIAESIQIRLRDYDVDVRTACHGMHGFYEAMSEKPDLIISDMCMPQGNGDYVVECLKNNTERREVPVVMLTGQRDPSLAEKMSRLGVEDFLTKPVRFELLKEVIAKYIPLHERELEEMAQ